VVTVSNKKHAGALLDLRTYNAFDA
jgi:hypothetical protein